MSQINIGDIILDNDHPTKSHYHLRMVVEKYRKEQKTLLGFISTPELDTKRVGGITGRVRVTPDNPRYIGYVVALQEHLKKYLHTFNSEKRTRVKEGLLPLIGKILAEHNTPQIFKPGPIMQVHDEIQVSLNTNVSDSKRMESLADIQSLRVEKFAYGFGTTTHQIDPYAKLAQFMIRQGTPNMPNQPILQHQTVVKGQIIDNMGTQQLLNLLRNLEEDKHDLGKYETKSASIDTMIADLNKAIDAVVKVMDAQHKAA